ncbi:MAG TPA: hypothetical protein VFU32_03180 [Ktedonobacterales bacterium]|nr:hypothetical protein [Ktedonobacterales bacterium]
MQTPPGLGTPAPAPGMPGGASPASAPSAPVYSAPAYMPGSAGAPGVPEPAAGMAPASGWQGPVGPQYPAGPFAPPMPQQPGAGAPGAPVDPKAGKAGQRRSKRSRAVKIAAAVLVLIVLAGIGAAYLLYRAQEPSSFVIATDRGNNEIARIDVATRNRTVLIKNTALKDSPDSIVFISDTQVLIDFVNGGNLGIGDIQNGTYTQVAQNQGTLRDMAVRPDGKSVLIASQDGGKLLEFTISDHSLRTFVQSQNLVGVQGLAFDPSGNLYAAVGGNVLQLDATTGKQVKTFQLPGGSDGMAYDQHLKTLDIASGNQILTLDPATGKIKTLLDGISETDGVAIDRHGNLFIASAVGVLELTTDNQLLIVGTDSNGVTWDDVAPLSGTGAASY